MNDGTRDQVSVSFPASPDFSRIGRVAVAGLALRLGVDIADVEKLRMAVDHSVEALHGEGRIHLHARWEPHQLTITIENPDEVLDETETSEVTALLAEMVDEVAVGSARINLTMASTNGRHQG